MKRLTDEKDDDNNVVKFPGTKEIYKGEVHKDNEEIEGFGVSQALTDFIDELEKGDVKSIAIIYTKNSGDMEAIVSDQTTAELILKSVYFERNVAKFVDKLIDKK